ncbi:MAG: glycoside hydrolase family 31 protein [bacterium]
MQEKTKSRIINNKRFTVLKKGLVRLEYDSEKKFNDNGTLKVPERPEGIKWKKIEQEDNIWTLETSYLKIIHKDNGEPFNDDNLIINMKCNQDNQKRQWQPSDRDEANLGGTLPSLDQFNWWLDVEGVHECGLGQSEIDYLRPILYAAWDAELRWEQEGKDDYKYMKTGIGYKAEFLRDELSEDEQKLVEGFRHYGPGVLSENGYFVLDDSNTLLIDENSGYADKKTNNNEQDFYFFAYGQNFQKAINNFLNLTGEIPLIPRWALGIWYCSWPTPKEQEAKEIVNKFAETEIPLDVMVLDMEWHRHGWSGWDWNEEWFSDPEGFIDWLHQNNVRCFLNIHPHYIPEADSSFEEFCDNINVEPHSLGENRYGEPEAIFDLGIPKHAQTFMELLQKPLLDQGVDGFWVDGAVNDQQGIQAQQIVDNMFFNYLDEEQPERRTMMLSRYGGIGNHRYPLHFSGDTASCWEVLKRQIDFTARAGNIGVTYWSHDIGGFGGKEPVIDPELYIRWVQFGAFSPVMRYHSAPGSGSRKPWDYGENNLEKVQKVLKLRAQLIPYIYSALYKTWSEGLPLCRHLYWDFPEDEKAYDYLFEYMFGDDILAAPVFEPGGHRRVYLPEGKWYRPGPDKIYEGKETYDLYVPLAQPLYFIKMGRKLSRLVPIKAP